MAPARYSGVSRERAPRAGLVPTGVERDPFVNRRLNNTVFVLEADVVDTAVTDIELKHGGLSVMDLGMPAPVTMTDGPVAVLALVDGAPVGDSGLLTLQVRLPGSSSYQDLAYFPFTT